MSSPGRALSVVALLMFLLVITGPDLSAGQPQSQWAQRDANLSAAEFLELYFTVVLHSHEQEAFNSFNLVNFYPAASASQGLVVIIQTYNDKGRTTQEADLRRQVREVGDGLVRDFEAQCRLPIVLKRWHVMSPRASLVIKHVRVNDLKDVLAVTLDGETSFEPTDFKRAEDLVKTRGGVWSW